MSNYIDNLTEQLQGKNVQAFTKEIKASQDLKKILRDQNEKKRQAKINADIQRLLKQ